MNDFHKMLEEQGIDLEELNQYIDSDEFILEAGPVVDYGNKNYELKDSDIDGLGIFANKNFKKGETIGYGKIEGARTVAGRYTNHSKKHNAKFYYFKKNDNMILLADKEIIKGEEIVTNYRNHTYNKEYYD